MTDLDPKLVKLHQHWLTADAVEEALRCYIGKEHSKVEGFSEELNTFCLAHSIFSVQKVLYALIYVVVEEYLQSSYCDETLDKLLSDDEKVKTLKRFRNATFHVQKDLISSKEMAFLDSDYNGSWIKSVHNAFDKFFTVRLDLTARLAKIRE